MHLLPTRVFFLLLLFQGFLIRLGLAYSNRLLTDGVMDLELALLCIYLSFLVLVHIK